MAKKTAVCIGINNYPGSENDLSGCLNDVKDWAEELVKRGYTVTKLTDSRATKKNILEKLAMVVESAEAGDSVFIQYSGHGSFVPDTNGDEPDGTDECLCPHDIDQNGDITDDEIYEIFSQKVRGVKLVMVSDSCHSGTVTRWKPGLGNGKKSKGKRVRFLPPETFMGKRVVNKLGTRISRASQTPGRNGSLLIAGCQDREYSYDAEFGNRPNGAFTYAALEALKTMNSRSTYSDWYKAIRELLPTQEYPQTPKLFGSTAMRKWKIFS